MLIDAEAITRATEIVDDTMFFREGHRRIFRAIISLVERLSGIDVVTLSDELDRRGELDAAGGREYLSFLADAVPTAANVEHHSRIVKEKALLRRLIEVSTQIAGEAFDVLHGEGGRYLGLHLHPWLFGMPYRTRYLAETLERLAGRSGAWQATAGEVADHILGQHATFSHTTFSMPKPDKAS